MAHTPDHQERLLRQALAADKIPIGIFVGAGCPVSIRVPTSGSKAPLIPDVAGLTAEVCAAIEASKDWKTSFTRICEQLNQDGFGRPTIEDILSQVRSLRQAAGSRELSGFSAKQLSDLDAEICRLIVLRVRVNLPTGSTPYHQLAAWVGAIWREQPIEIFTTNYDVLLEQALEIANVPYFDGFVGSELAFLDLPSMELDQLPPRWARLWKLHGSVSWTQKAGGRVFRMPANYVEGDYVIHPSHLKYEESRRMPYLAMIDRVRAFLKRAPSILVICGYSFRDQHINEVLNQELQGNPRATCFALMHGRLSSYPAAVECAGHRANLSLLARDGAVIGTIQSPWSRPEIDGEAGGPSTVAEFSLGDFGAFGQFLASHTGATS